MQENLILCHKSGRSAFSLVELVTVVAVLALLMAAGARFLGDPGSKAQKTATDALVGLVEQARTTAIVSRSIVVLAIAEPGDLPSATERCLIGTFKINEWSATAMDGMLIRRWQSLPSGALIIPGDVKGQRNPRDEPEISLRYSQGKQIIQGRFHIIAFSPSGGLHWPAGSDSVVLRIAEGGYRNGQPTPNPRGSKHSLSGNCLKIGRITARPFRIDG